MNPSSYIVHLRCMGTQENTDSRYMSDTYGVHVYTSDTYILSPTSCRLKSAHMKFHKSSHRSFMSKPRHYCRMRCTRFKSERSQPSRGFFAGGGAPAAGARTAGLEFHLAAYRFMSNLRLHPSSSYNGSCQIWDARPTPCRARP